MKKIQSNLNAEKVPQFERCRNRIILLCFIIGASIFYYRNPPITAIKACLGLFFVFLGGYLVITNPHTYPLAKYIASIPHVFGPEEIKANMEIQKIIILSISGVLITGTFGFLITTDIEGLAFNQLINRIFFINIAVLGLYDLGRLHMARYVVLANLLDSQYEKIK